MEKDECRKYFSFVKRLKLERWNVEVVCEFVEFGYYYHIYLLVDKLTVVDFSRTNSMSLLLYD